MKIVVCIKQVPDTTDIKWTENNTLQREGVESIINPFDEYALETALRIKDKYGATVTAISMGPPQAEEMLRKAIALGCDSAFLVSDKKFSGADTVATSRTLASAIKAKIPDYDLIICGQFATDGDTAQTGPSIAEKLDIPQVTYVKEITLLEDKFLTVKKEIEEGVQTLRVQIPGLICMQKCDYELRQAHILGYIKAQLANVPTYNSVDLNIEPSEVGIKGSPTYVSKAFRPEQKQRGEIIEPQSVSEAVSFIVDKIESYKAEYSSLASKE